jgi:hypothetical protein
MSQMPYRHDGFQVFGLRSTFLALVLSFPPELLGCLSLHSKIQRVFLSLLSVPSFKRYIL